MAPSTWRTAPGSRRASCPRGGSRPGRPRRPSKRHHLGMAVGSAEVSVRLCPSASSRPPRVSTAPTGTSPRTQAARACSSARAIQRRSFGASGEASRMKGDVGRGTSSRAASAASGSARRRSRRGAGRRRPPCPAGRGAAGSWTTVVSPPGLSDSRWTPVPLRVRRWNQDRCPMRRQRPRHRLRTSSSATGSTST